MSINSQIMATMESEGIVEDQGLEDTKVFSPVAVNTGRVNTSDQTPVTDALKKRLLNPLNQIKSINEGIEKVFTMQDVQENINKKPGISFADAEEVAMSFESFTKSVSLKEFTQVPSQVNYAFTKRFMENNIQLRKENVCTEAELFFNGHLAEQEEALEDYKLFFGKQTLEDLECFRQKVEQFLADPQNIKNQYIIHGLGGFNMATKPLKELLEDGVFPPNSEKFQKAVTNLNNIFQNNIHAKPLLEAVKSKEGFDTFISSSFTGNSFLVNPSLVDILSMFKDPYLQGIIKAAEETATEAVDELSELQEDSEMNPADFNSVRDFMVENGVEIQELQSKIHYYTETIDLVQHVFLNATAVYEYFLTEQ